MLCYRCVLKFKLVSILVVQQLLKYFNAILSHLCTYIHIHSYCCLLNFGLLLVVVFSMFRYNKILKNNNMNISGCENLQYFIIISTFPCTDLFVTNNYNIYFKWKYVCKTFISYFFLINRFFIYFILNTNTNTNITITDYKRQNVSIMLSKYLVCSIKYIFDQ